MNSANRRKTSPLWAYFTELSGNEKKAKCDMCSQKLSYRSSISNLKKHLDKRHPTINLKLDERCANSSPVTSTSISNTGEVISDSQPSNSNNVQPQTSTETINTNIIVQPCSNPSKSKQVHRISSFYVPKKVSEGQAKKVDNQLKLFITDYQSFSIVEDKEFVEFVKALNPSYQLPGRKAISKNMIPALYERCLNTVQEKMDSVKSVCITTDCWTLRNVDSYLAETEDCSLNSVLIGSSLITGSHTSENIKNMIAKFKLSNKVLIAVTDNACNIKKAINSHLQWKHFGCYAHTLNLIVQDSLEEVQELVNKIKTIVAHLNVVQQLMKN
jgi:hypothetical protein